jgi:hypothetical protein
LEIANTQEKLALKQMYAVLSNLGIPLTVCWLPDPRKSAHGEIKNNVICIYDSDETVAMETFVHELLEFKLKLVTEVYRALVNSLIETYEKLCYKRKEEFLDSLPKVLEVIAELKSHSD